MAAGRGKFREGGRRKGDRLYGGFVVADEDDHGVVKGHGVSDLCRVEVWRVLDVDVIGVGVEYEGECDGTA